MADYQSLLDAANKREKEVRAVFDKYDDDDCPASNGHGTLEEDEIMLLLEELGLLKPLKSSKDRVEFLAEQMCKFDTNDDGVLTFDEFKPFYNACKDLAAGKKRTAPARTVSGLSEETNNARMAAMKEKKLKKAEEAERLRKQNAEMKARIANKGAADSKALDAETEKARKEFLLQKRQKKEAEAKALAAQNKAHKSKLKGTGSRTDHDINDDVAADGGTMGDSRTQKAQEGRDKLASREADYKQRGQDLKTMKATTGSRTDHDINDDVAAGGGTMGDARSRKAQEGRDKLDAREADYIQREQQLKKMKATTGAVVDDDIDDDQLAGGGTMGDARSRKAQEGREKLASREADYKQRGQDLKTMKATTGAKVDDDLCDDEMAGGGTMGEFRGQMGLKN